MKHFKLTIAFEYDSEEGAPLTGKPIKTAEDAIQAVRDELEAMSPHDFIIDCEVYNDGDFQYNTKG